MASLPSLPFRVVEPVKVHRPAPERFAELAAGNQPFILQGCIDHWPLYRTLRQLESPVDQVEYLADLLPKKKVGFTWVPAEQRGILGFDQNLRPNFSLATKSAPFSDFARQCTNSLWNPDAGTLYLQSMPIPELTRKLGGLDLFEGLLPVMAPRFWIGTGGQKVVLHNDPFRNAIAVFAGTKRVTLFPPAELPNLYIAPLDRRVAGVLSSIVTVTDPDLQKFPKFEQALESAQVAVLEAGEILFLPALWWHHVEGFGLNVGINCWFRHERPVEKLYVPCEGLMTDLKDVPLDARQSLHATFVAAIDGTLAELPADADRLHRRTFREAMKVKARLDDESLGDQAAQWRAWVLAFAEWAVFRLRDPFPTLPEGEADRMLARMSSLGRRLFRPIEVHMPPLVARVWHWLSKNKEHGVVPMEGRQYPRTACDHVVTFAHDAELVTACMVNHSLGGAYILSETPPPVGSRVVLSREGVRLRGEVVWSNAEAEDPGQRGFGLRWDSPAEADVALRSLTASLS